MSEPLQKIRVVLETNEGYTLERNPTNQELAEVLNAAIDRINELEAEQSEQIADNTWLHNRITELEARYEGHRHEFHFDDNGEMDYTTEPPQENTNGE